MKKEEELYILTLKGLLSLTIKDHSILDATLNSLELYLRRNYSKNGHPAIVFDTDENKFYFATLTKD